MKRNMSNLDRALRAVAGILLLGWALLSQHPLHWWGLVGLVPLGTALIGFCPLYACWASAPATSRSPAGPCSDPETRAAPAG